MVSGAVGVDREAARRGRRVDVTGGVGRADLEGVRAVGERAVVCGDVQRAEPPAVERGTGSWRRPRSENVERRRGRRGRAGGPCRSSSPAPRVDREGPARRQSVEVAGGVGRTDLEGVRAVGQRAAWLRRGAGVKRPPSSRHSKVRRPRSVNVKVGVSSVVGPAGPELISVSGALRVDREGPRSPGSGRCCRRRRWRAPRRCAGRRERARDRAGEVHERERAARRAGTRSVGRSRSRRSRRSASGRRVGPTARSRSSSPGRGVDREAAARRRRVGVAGRVGRPHLEGVRAVDKQRRSCAATSRPRTAPPSTRHSKVAARLVGELERRRGVVRRAGRPAGDDRVGRDRVDGEAPARRGRVDVARGSVARTSKVCAPSASVAAV